MCDTGHAHGHDQFGFLVDSPEIRALVEATERAMASELTPASCIDALAPEFSRLLAADGWLPSDYAQPDETSRMGDGIDASHADLEVGKGQTLHAGDLYPLLPPTDDIHYVKTTSPMASISIHLLANDTACIWRHKFDSSSGAVSAFRSGYANAPCPPE